MRYWVSVTRRMKAPVGGNGDPKLSAILSRAATDAGQNAATRSGDRHPGEFALADLEHRVLATRELQRAIADFLAVQLHPALVDHPQRLGRARSELRLLEHVRDRRAAV